MELKTDAILNVVVVVVVVVVVLVVVVVVGVSLGSTCLLERQLNLVQVQSCVKKTHGHASVL